MSSINSKTVVPAPRTAEGAVAARITPLQELVRTAMSCMLWENIAYENGQSVADRIKSLVHQVTLREAAAVAVEARNNMKLRHVPLLIVREMARHPKKGKANDLAGSYDPRWISDALAEVIQRPDELTEFLAIYWKDGKQPLSKQVKLGLAKAFQKFNEYSLAKYNRDKDITLKDVLFLCHSKPKDVPADGVWNKLARQAYAAAPEGSHARQRVLAQCGKDEGFTDGELLYGKLIYDQLKTPDTWEVELSKNGNTAEAWMRLLSENKLGDLAFLRNLRNMTDKGVPVTEIVAYGDRLKWGRVLPFRFLSAAKYAPSLEQPIERWMMKCVAEAPKLPGTTLLIMDVSGSMNAMLSGKSELNRLQAAAALTVLARELCEDATIYVTAGSDGAGTHATKLIPARRGMALADYITVGSRKEVGGGGIFLTQCLDFIDREQRGRQFDRVIVFTDEQDCDRKLRPDQAKLLGANNYLINVSSEKNGIGYRKWLHIDGFSEAVVDYIRAYEESLQ